MINGYTTNKSILYLIALLKKFGVKKAVVSPGTTNLEFVSGLQYDGNFELYSSIDERSAAYMACGIASETNEPVIIACTESTASRDYFPGVTEAFYRKLPLIVITGVHSYSEIGHLQPQIIDRSISPKDVFKIKEQLPVIKDEEDEYATVLMINRALLELYHNGSGPIHIDLPCCNFNYNFSIQELPNVKKITRYDLSDTNILPNIPSGKIAIFIGSHLDFTEKENLIIDKFCEKYNAFVFHDHTSGYNGRYGINASLMAFQHFDFGLFGDIDLLIHIGESSGDGPTSSKLRSVKKVWRVSEDGAIRDTFKKLENVFEMKVFDFFWQYVNKQNDIKNNISLLNNFKNIDCDLREKITDLPLSNIFIASYTSSRLPENSIIHLGVSNTIRAWSLFNFPKSVKSRANVGCRGIDGIISSAMGASITKKSTTYFCIVGDLMFFYDLNAIGNRSIGNNLRILLINNNGGGVFKLSGAPGHEYFGDDDTNKYIAASGHFGNTNSSAVIKNYSENLGFLYLYAETKDQFIENSKLFLSEKSLQQSIVFEVKVTDNDERKAFDIIRNLKVDTKKAAKDFTKRLIGEKATNFLRQLRK